MGAADDVARLRAQIDALQQSVAGLQADAHRATAVLEQQGPRVAQGIQQGGEGVNRASASAPTAASGLQQIGYGVGNLGTGIAQAGGSLERSSANAQSGFVEGAKFLGGGVVLAGLTWGGVKLALAYMKRHRREEVMR